MIKFPCKCGYEFEVAEERAGEPLQCPRCMLLNEVPLLSDLADLENDGTIRLEPIPIEEEGKREEELRRTYLPRRQDDDGNDIDMRNTFEQFVNAGADNIPLQLKDHLRPGAPRYDPVTGEMVRALSVRGDEAKPVIPIAVGPPMLQYQKNYQSPALAIWRAPLLLFTPSNGAVLLIMVGMQLAMLGVWILIGEFLLFGALIPAFIYMLTIAHVANIVEETGPEEKDELPTPMRGASWYEDVWMPFWRFAISFVICYWPAFLVLFARAFGLKASHGTVINISRGLVLAGSFFFPAVLLTATAGGTYVNLRPDRVVGTITAIGVRYVLVALLWCASAWLFLHGTIGGIAWATSLTSMERAVEPPPHIGISVAEIAISIYLLHMFGWILGGLYRSCHDNFPWAFQRHIFTNRIEGRIVRHGKPMPRESKDPGILAPEPPPPRLHVRPVQE